MKIGSLFDGSGGFPLAASMCGIEPVWASEVEPYPIAVTRSRFPNMKHLGSVTEVKGNEVEPVDVITFGSPCQDLSVAGKRAGLKHTENGDDETTRSGLFMEAIRIIKEMREATNGVYPRFAVWENVPGAFSSNKGDDFRIVLEEFIRISEPSAVMPEVPKAGWPYADVYCGDGWSLAYRVLDAQYWGVPQRRRRIYLVADFRGQRAGKVSFEREGLRGYFAESGTPREAVAGDAESGTGATDCELIPYTLKIRSGVAVDSAGKAAGKGALIQTNKAATLAATQDQYLFQPVSIREENWSGSDVKNALRAGESKSSHVVVQPVVESAGFKELNSAKARSDGYEHEKAPCLAANKHDACCVYSVENHPADSRVNIDDSGKVQTLTSRMGTGGGNVPMVMEPIPIHDQATRFSGKRGDKDDGKGNGLGVGEPGDPMNTLTGGDRHAVVYAIEGNGARPSHLGDGYSESDSMYTLNTIERHAVCYADTYQKTTGPLMANSHPGSYSGQDAYNDMFVVGKEDVVGAVYVDTSHADDVVRIADTVSALQSRDYKGGKLVAMRYIVRRLTPTECARLQGFPDAWGHPDIKTELTDEEYRFWCEVYLTKALIDETVVPNEDGVLYFKSRMKPFAHKTKDQMLTWYNKLHTDSSEYKMWGNGIALPCALYVMQGISEVLYESRN